jgi:hypothetical protein
VAQTGSSAPGRAQERRDPGVREEKPILRLAELAGPARAQAGDFEAKGHAAALWLFIDLHVQVAGLAVRQEVSLDGAQIPVHAQGLFRVRPPKNAEIPIAAHQAPSEAFDEKLRDWSHNARRITQGVLTGYV